MRMIELRVWNKIKKEMSYEICEIDFNLEKLSYHHNIREDGCGLCSTFDFKDLEIMQYTGLKDKNRKKIYEGDIIKVIQIGNCHYFPMSFKGIYEVKFIRQSFIIFSKDKMNSTHVEYLGELNEDCIFEIIGNIYQN